MDLDQVEMYKACFFLVRRFTLLFFVGFTFIICAILLFAPPLVGKGNVVVTGNIFYDPFNFHKSQTNRHTSKVSNVI